MIRTIFGISLVVILIRAGTAILPRIGPSTKPRKRSMIVQAAPKATWKKVSGQSSLTAIATTRAAKTIATGMSPRRGTIWKAGVSIGGPGGGPGGGAGVVWAGVAIDASLGAATLARKGIQVPCRLTPLRLQR